MELRGDLSLLLELQEPVPVFPSLIVTEREATIFLYEADNIQKTPTPQGVVPAP